MKKFEIRGLSLLQYSNIKITLCDVYERHDSVLGFSFLYKKASYALLGHIADADKIISTLREKGILL